MKIDISKARRCDNPECRRTVTWVTSRGRPAKYCSNQCRQRERRLRSTLKADLVELDKRRVGGVSYRERRRIDGEIARIEWALSAFVDD